MKDDMTIGDITELVEKSSTTFEMVNGEIKRRFLLWNISAYNIIASKVDTGIATFGTGYPFYVLDSNLEGEIPVIPEQIRYNRQLIKDSKKWQKSIFECKSCLVRNYDKMKDLKTICKPCPNTPDSAKPRKLINRLPDLDLWLICQDGKLEETKTQLKQLLEEHEMLPSDIDPLGSIEKVTQISQALKAGKLPPKDLYLPIDTHIVEYSYLKNLIECVPAELAVAKKKGKAPYLPIYPTSLRKDWQHDDTAYNFIYDFLAAFTPFNFPTELNTKLNDTRISLTQIYTPEELFEFVQKAATDANATRLRTPAVKKIFLNKMEYWKALSDRLLTSGKSENKPEVPSAPSMDDGL